MAAAIVMVQPARVVLWLTRLALAEEQDVDDDIRAGIGAKTAFGQAYGGDEVGGFGDEFAGRGFRLVHRARRGDEGGERAGF